MLEFIVMIVLKQKGVKRNWKIYKKYHELTDRYHAYDNINNIYYINNNTDDVETITIEKELYDVIKYGIDFYEKVMVY